jgi:DMSO/TMAO reductase YedYZ molybdopterin-dependent catalytic subunit
MVTDGTNEQSYSVDDLKALGAEEAAFQEVTYTGVPLRLLLEDAGFDPASVSAVKATAADGFSANYDPELVNRPDTLVAYARADGPLAEEDGTFRMVLPDQEGKLNPRDLVELRVYP